MSIAILGAGKALGSVVQPNWEVEDLAGQPRGWVLEKTGITQRHLAGPGETTSSLALDAAQKAIEQAGIDRREIGLVVCCTFANDYLFPSLAARLHRDLALSPECFVLDIQQNCSGFLAALVMVNDRMNADPSIKYALIVGAEVLSPFIDPTDQNTAPFFSDGAGAVVIHNDSEDRDSSEYGLRSSAFTMDTSSYEAVRCLRGRVIEQAGLVTWKLAVKRLPGVIRTAVERAGWTIDEVDVFLPHQANLVLLEFLASRLGWKDKLYTTVATNANTGSASVGCAINDAMEAGVLVPGKKVVLAGIGAGFSFGAVCFET